MMYHSKLAIICLIGSMRVLTEHIKSPIVDIDWTYCLNINYFIFDANVMAEQFDFGKAEISYLRFCLFYWDILYTAMYTVDSNSYTFVATSAQFRSFEVGDTMIDGVLGFLFFYSP